MLYPSSLNNVIENFKRLPGVGQKTAERLGFSILDFSLDDIEDFSKSLLDVKNNLVFCKECGGISDTEICSICSDVTRNDERIIVVEEPKDVFVLEKVGIFDGYYHVLGGLISPIDGIGPNDISIVPLINRIKEKGVTEIILAIKSGIEADTTALYIKKMLDGFNIKVSKLASGIPIGADMDYVDSLTLESALSNRKEVL